MVFVTGDIHGVSGAGRLSDLSLRSVMSFPCAKEQHYLIVCGDFGLVWYNEGTPERLQEENTLNWLAKQKHITLFVDGNHENFERLYRYPVVDFMGGKAHKLNEKVYHLMRGQIYEIQGNRLFVLGGAVSVDKHLRTEHVSWWRDEVPSPSEYAQALSSLSKVNNEVDYVLTHCTSTENAKRLDKYFYADEVTEALSKIMINVKYKRWYSGHYHLDKDCGRYTCLYRKIVPLGNTVSGRQEKMEKRKSIQVGDTVRLIEKDKGRWFEGKLTKFVGKKAHVQLPTGYYVEMDKKLWCLASEPKPDEIEAEEQGTPYEEINERAVKFVEEQADNVVGNAEQGTAENVESVDESVVESVDDTEVTPVETAEQGTPLEATSEEFTPTETAEQGTLMEEPVIVKRKQMPSPLDNF